MIEYTKDHKNIYDNVLEKNYTNWVKDFPELLESIPEKYVKKVALILENQTLFNRFSKQNKTQDENNKKFIEFSLEITKKVFGNFLGFEIVNIQPIISPNALLFYTKFNYNNDIIKDIPEFEIAITEENVSAKSRILPKFLIKSKDYKDFLEKFAKEYRIEIFREIITDLRNNVGTLINANYNEEEHQIYNNLAEMSEVIHRKNLKSGLNWIVTGKEIAKKLQKYLQEKVDIDALDEPTYIGTMCSVWKVIVDPMHPEDEILAGYHKDEDLCGSYFYCPYIPISTCGNAVGVDGFDIAPTILARYSKRLVELGSSFYGRIKYTKPTESNTNYQI